MSVITVLKRVDAHKLDLYRNSPDDLFERGGEEISIDKTGPGIVWLLSRDPAHVGLSSLLEGKGATKEMGLDDPSIMGPPVSLTVQQVKDVAALLESIGDDVLRSRYDPAVMTSELIYPWFWNDGGANAWEYLLVNFHQLRSFFSLASEARQQVLIWWS
ncbi:MAG TPA: DUF1877 family protein [Chthoniobacteraceae bacterium]|nr:DUF1877 family protein [Chthoniobacteraceae bacterium]